jgi:FkbM family methyltransferase
VNILRRILRRWPILFDSAKALSRRLGNRTELYSFLNDVIPRRAAVTFLQIGAGDGVMNDPYREFILRNNFRGVLVEPLASQFARLQRNYSRKKGVAFANCAVSYPPRPIKIFLLAEDFLAQHPGRDLLLLQAASSRTRLLESLSICGVSEVEEHVIEVEVPAMTAEALQAEYGFSSFDCLFLDLEGHESNVLLNLNYQSVKPKLIAYEHIYLESSATIENHLKAMNFVVSNFSQDTVAVSPEWTR